MYSQNNNTTTLVPIYRALVPQQDRQAEWTTKLTQAHNNLSMPLSDPMKANQLSTIKQALKAAHKILGEFNEQVSKNYITVPPGAWTYNLPPGEKTPSQTIDNPFSAAEELRGAIKIIQAVLENVKNGWWALEKEKVVPDKKKDGEDEEELDM